MKVMEAFWKLKHRKQIQGCYRQSLPQWFMNAVSLKASHMTVHLSSGSFQEAKYTHNESWSASRGPSLNSTTFCQQFPNCLKNK